MLWADTLKRMNFTGSNINDGQEKPYGEQDSESDFGLLEVFEGLSIFEEDVDGVEEVLLELVFGGGWGGKFLEILGALLFGQFLFVLVEWVFAHLLLVVFLEPELRREWYISLNLIKEGKGRDE